MTQIARSLVATVSLMALWFLAFALQALGVAVWGIVLISALSAVNLIVLMGLFHQLTVERDRGDGGSGTRALRPDTPEPGAGGPSWWPQFERELAQYVADQERRNGSSQRVPAGSVDVT